MEKIISKKIKKIITNFDKNAINNDIKYINNLKSSLYFISKLIYANKYINKINLKEFFNNYVENMKLFDEKSVLLFKSYTDFEFSDKSYELKILEILAELNESTDINNLNISALYENLISDKERKILGQVYTPDAIIDEMLDLAFEGKEINNEFKIIDPSCGGGYFLINAYRRIKEKVSSDKHILENIIYGVDVDRFSCFMTKISLCFESNIADIKYNIFHNDFLIDFETAHSFDVIIGNPPYIGHKNIGRQYREALKNKYIDVFYDKSDISYCFFKAGQKFLNEKGKICFITSRYFLEAKYADRLRDYIKNNFNVLKIIDYNGQKAFKNVNISPMIILMDNITHNTKFVEVKKYNSQGEFISFNVGKTELCKDGWVLLNNKQKQIYDKIISKCNFKIGEIGYIKQGIITGYDVAFIVSEEDIIKNNLEKELIRKWIKNSNISDDGIDFGGLYILYTNLIEDESKYPNALEYLSKYKDRLSNRRECKSGVRKWYELQWGRSLSLFESNKIIFPYKAKNNNFYYDTGKFLCSADIYTMNVDVDKVNYDYIVNYLNSSIFEFIFKCNAKKVGEKLYEYYPNKLENMQIFIPEDKSDKSFFENNKKYIENYLEKVFNITLEEKVIINNYID
jgi:adenine-specific DNA-methyltransferase